jgi:monoamine oxidase
MSANGAQLSTTERQTAVAPVLATGLTRRAALAAAAGAVGAAASLAGCRASDGPVAQGVWAGVSAQRGHALRDGRWPPAGAQPGRVQRTRVLIAGGGVAGLAAARALHQRGQEAFALLELEDQPGGNSRGVQVAGMPAPLGAHYLPVPGAHLPEVQQLLHELGVGAPSALTGQWVWDERALCHSPQDRLFFQGAWQEGLLPLEGVGASTRGQYQRFSQCIAAVSAESSFRLPVWRATPSPLHLRLDAQTFAQWLDAQGLVDPHLRWYLDYACRDDYGAGANTVSAWAGIHYFASRHGFAAPGEAAERDAVLTWPQGNGWLTERMAQPLGDRVHTGQVVCRIEAHRHGVTVDSWDVARQMLVRWQAQHCVVALPLAVAARVVVNPPDVLRQAAAIPHAAWVVANLGLNAPLADRPGAAPAWDNVVYGGAGLGYVNAAHQLLTQPGASAQVLTWYCALGVETQARAALAHQPWTHWRDRLLAELEPAHPDLPDRLRYLVLTPHAHAMATPVPGILNKMAIYRNTIGHSLLSKYPNRRASQATAAGSGDASPRLWWAHGDWAGYSVFEECFTQGHAVGLRV